ncbi:autotransporter serine protease [Sebaldella sp. S0638]|uniref:autotransporter serine protease n=1 Tax=Sebaldella sp. S0638 TaxID=2957809 RepID=UPI00209DD273|nr:autotransporter serine protease [Sebaldella sp. S0638]MCP1223900.1 autotransporter domain-containing protein [Sebaldella sp. S0638]
MKKKFLLVAVLLIALTACGSSGGGGGGGGNGTPATPIPTSPDTSTPNVTVPDAPYVPFNKTDPHKASSAKSSGITGTGVTIGIIDTGFETANAEFKDSLGNPRISTDPAFTGNTNIHGSLVAEVAGGKTIGMAPNVTIKAISAGATCTDGGDTCVDTNLSMYQSLYNDGVRIFNQSFGADKATGAAKKSEFPLTDPVIDFFYKRATTDSLFVWATGNGSSLQPGAEAGLPFLYPALEKGWIAVTAVDSQTGLIADYANQCGLAQNWCIAAVGDYSFYAKNVNGKGTSFATPAVTGAAALVQQKYPWMNGDLLRQTLLSTATDMGKLGVDSTYGWGLLNVEKAVKGPALFDKKLALGNYVNISFDTVTSYFQNDISGDAGVIKSGTGKLVLSGNNTYTGDNIVNGGTLTVNGKVISQVQIQSNGTFSSNGGYVDNNVINNGGTFVNESNGTIIAGNYTASSDSITESTADSTINVKGKAVLSGSVLKVAAPKDENDRPVYISSTNSIQGNILVADQGIESSFGSVETPVLLSTELKYSENNVGLEMTRKDVSVYSAEAYNSDATRDNTASNLEQVFKILDNGTGNEAFRTQAAYLQQTASSKVLAASLDSLSGQIYASAQALTFQQSQTINKDLSNRLTWLGSMTNPADSTGIWFNGIGSVGRLYQSGYAEADTYLYGGQIGVDKAFNSKFILGASLSFSDSKADFDRYAGESKSQNLGLSLYGRYGLENDTFYVLGRIGGAYVSSDVERDVIVGSYKDNLSVNHDDYVLSGYGEVGYKLKTSSAVSITPYAGLLFDSVNRGSFSEDNSLFGLKADSKTYSQTSGLLGLRAEGSFNWAAGKSTVLGYFSWQTAFNDEDLSYDASYIGLPNEKFKIKGIGLADNTAWTGVGILTEVTPVWSWYANYDMQIERSKVMNNVFSVGARINLN